MEEIKVNGVTVYILQVREKIATQLFLPPAERDQGVVENDFELSMLSKDSMSIRLSEEMLCIFTREVRDALQGLIDTLDYSFSDLHETGVWMLSDEVDDEVFIFGARVTSPGIT